MAIAPVQLNVGDIPWGGAPGEAELRAVLSLAARGWRLFPCLPRSKRPYIKEWPARATADSAQLRAWARNLPGCNWAMATGPGSDVWAMDCDVKPCPSCPPDTRRVDGEKTLSDLMAQHGALPNTLVTVTSHGAQYLFKYPSGHTIRNDNSGKKLGDGLDIRGDGGYVLVPPSVHPEGIPYGFVDADAEIADTPEWLIPKVETVAPSPATIATAKTAITGFGRGQRHNRLTHVIGRMLADGMSNDAIEKAALAENATFHPPKTEEDVGKLVADMTERYARGVVASPLTPRRAELVTLSSILAREVEWLWRPYLASGTLAMLSGDPSAGKTWISLAVAASLTVGQVPYSGEQCAPTDVVYLTNENDDECVVKPRFDALGGDSGRFHHLTASLIRVGNTEKRGPIWLTDLDVLRDALTRTCARLIVVDPIQSFLGAQVDAHRSNETRPVLDGLARIAQEYRCCILLLRHLGKAQTGRAIHRGLGSIDLTGAVRTEMLAGCSPDDPQRRAMVQIKNNLGAFGSALGFEIGETGQFRWTGKSVLTQSDLLAPERAGQEHTAKSEAAEWLRTYLANCSRTAKEVEHAARAAGLSWATVRRAKKDVGVQSQKAAFGDGWVWQLAEDAHQHSEGAQPTVLSTLGNDEHLGVQKRERGEL